MSLLLKHLISYLKINFFVPNLFTLFLDADEGTESIDGFGASDEIFYQFDITHKTIPLPSG